MDNRQLFYYNKLVKLTQKGGLKEGWTILSSHYVATAKHMRFMCPKGHIRDIAPLHFKVSVNGCRECVGGCPKVTEKKFREAIAKQGGKVIGEYKKNSIGVLCICPNRHECTPTLTAIKRGGMCRKCAGKCPKEVEKNFRETIAKQGGRLVGQYEGANRSVSCIRVH
jgi:hypothetical protein